MTNIYTITNETIEFHKKQQLFLLERYNVTKESYNYWFNKFMLNPNNKDIELKMLKAFEFMTYDKQNIESHKNQEMNERLRIASELLNSYERV